MGEGGNREPALFFGTLLASTFILERYHSLLRDMADPPFTSDPKSCVIETTIRKRALRSVRYFLASSEQSIDQSVHIHTSGGQTGSAMASQGITRSFQSLFVRPGLVFI